MKLGLLVEAEEGLDWERWRAIFRGAERLGFASVWVADHLQSPWNPAARGLEAWTALAVAAAETRSIRLGPLVSPVTFREPALVARMAADLDALSRGRFTLGIGLGWNDAEHAQFGIAFPRVGKRSQRLVRTVACIREVAPRVRVLIGGMGRKATLPLVAAHADAWNMTTSSAAVVRELGSDLLRLGREPATVERSVAVGVLVGRDADDLARRAARLQRRVPSLEGTDPVGAAREIGWVAGTPDELAAQLRGLAEAGIGEAMLGLYDFDDLEVLAVLAEEVMPRL